MIQIQKILASDGAANDQFGTSVAISTDASTILVGAPMDDDNGTDSGSAYVFARSGLQWILQAKLLASDGGSAGDEFGISVALSSNGDTAIVGAHLDDTAANNNRGRAYVYVRSGTTWTQQARLTAADAANNDRFGISVALSADGNTALVGSHFDNAPAANQGSAYIFTRSGVTWTQQAKITAADGVAADQFGIAVALSSDGSTAIVGAYLNDPGGNNRGAAYVFTRSGVTWTQQQKLTATDAANGDRFGISVALSADGNTGLIGAYFDNILTNANQGSAYVFTRSGATWTQQAKLTAGDGAANDEFGISVSLSSNGNVALVGNFLDDVGANTDQGSAYVFYRSGTAWTQQQKLLASDGAAQDNFGNTVSLSGGGQIAVVGSILDDDNGTASGSAYIFAELIRISDINLCCNPIKSDCSFCVCFQMSDALVRQKLIHVYISDVFQVSDTISDNQRTCYQLTAPSANGDFQVKIDIRDAEIQAISDIQTQILYVRSPTCPSYLSGCSGLPFMPTASGSVLVTGNLSDALDRVFVQHQLVSCDTCCCCSSFVIDMQSDLQSLIGFLDRSDLPPGSGAQRLRQLITCC